MQQKEDPQTVGYVGNMRKRDNAFGDKLYKMYESELTLSEKYNINKVNSGRDKTKSEKTIRSTLTSVITYILLIGCVASLEIFIKSKTGEEFINYLSTDFDICSPNPCLNNGVCIDEEEDFTCQCKHWYSGKTCELDNRPCKNHECKNGATCINNQDGSYRCRCVPHFAGRYCEIYQ